MAQLTKAQLATQNAADFPNNNLGLITPAILRDFNTDMIDSLVDEVSYNIDSASFSASIAQLQGFSSSLDATFATDAQLTSLSASIAVTDLSQSSSIAALQQFSSSLDATFATDAQLTALSTSIAVTDSGQDSKINSLTNATSSYITSAQTSSMNVLSSSFATSASFATTASFALNVTPTDVSPFLSASVFNSYTQSNDTKWNNLGNQSGSFITESETGSFAKTNINNSFGGTQTFQNVIVTNTASVEFLNVTYQSSSVVYSSGSNILGNEPSDIQTLWGEVDIKNSLAATGSISASAGFFGNLNGTASFATSATSASFALTASEARNVVLIARNGNASTLGAGTIVHITGASGDNPIFDTASFDTEALSANSLGVLRNAATTNTDVEVLVNGIVLGVNTDPALGYAAGDILYLSSSGQFTKVQPQAPKQIVVIGQVLRAQQNNGSIYVNITNGWEIDELHNVAINSVEDGDLLVYRSGSGLWTNSSSIELGNATTGSNTFVGKQIVSQSLLVRSGSIYSISNNTTIDPELYYSASTAGQVNIIRGWGDDPAASGVTSVQANFTSSFRITGSNNIITLPLQRATNIAGGTADMTGYISGSANTLVNGLAGIYLNSGSQLFPKTIGNTLGANSNILMTFTTSSLGNPAVNNNTINGANFVINHPSGSVNLASVNLLLGGTITSSQAFVTNVRPNINQNINVGNITTLRHISSSINYTANIGNSVVTVENFMSSSGLTSGNSVAVTNNAFFGGAAGVFQSIFVSGSQSANSTRNIIDNLFGGRNNQITASLVSSSASNVVSNIVYGQTLIVNGNQGPSGGSAFFGRFNDTGSNLSSLADIVFAVGTGVTTGTRKTGLWIDSASLTTINGGLYVTQSQVSLQNSGGLALSVSSGSVEIFSTQGTGYFYSNLPVTSSNLRINGDGIIADLFVSGVFAGNSSLRVLGKSGFTGSVDIANNLSVSGGLAITGSNPTIQSGSLSGSLISNLGDIYTGSNNAQYIVTLGSASMATLLSGSTTNGNTLYFVI